MRVFSLLHLLIGQDTSDDMKDETDTPIDVRLYYKVRAGRDRLG